MVRRAISALIGPGGQATDQPIRKPDKSSGAIAMSLIGLDSPWGVARIGAGA
jgi:hypothetical protein